MSPLSLNTPPNGLALSTKNQMKMAFSNASQLGAMQPRMTSPNNCVPTGIFTKPLGSPTSTIDMTLAILSQTVATLTSLVAGLTNLISGLFNRPQSPASPYQSIMGTPAAMTQPSFGALNGASLFAQPAATQAQPQEEKKSLFSSLLDKGINFISTKFSEGSSFLTSAFDKVAGFFGF